MPYVAKKEKEFVTEMKESQGKDLFSKDQLEDIDLATVNKKVNKS